MKKTLAILAATGVVLATASAANAGSSFGVSINSGPAYYPAPVYYAPQPVYYAPQPYYAPRPVYYAPSYYAPYTPSYRINYWNGGGRGHGHGHGRGHGRH